MFFLLYELFSKKVANYWSLSSRITVSVKIWNKSINLSDLFFITCSILKIQKNENLDFSFYLIEKIELLENFWNFAFFPFCTYTNILFAKFPFLRKIDLSLPENHSFSNCIVSIGFLLSPKPTF